jgi:hypothetical protein
MTIFIQNAPTATDQLPTIIYDNLFSSGTLTASTEAVDYPKENAVSENTTKSWQPTTLPATLTIDKTIPVSADCFALVAHNCGTKGNAVFLESSSDNVTWTTRCLVTPNDDTTLMGLFTSVSARYWRLRVTFKNPLLYTEQFDNAVWTKTRTTVTANATLSPDLTTTADKIVETAIAGTHIVRQTVTGLVANTTHTFTAYVKAAERTKGLIRMENGADGIAGNFQLDAGTISLVTTGAGSGGVVSIEALPDSWWRVRISGIVNASVTSYDCDLTLRDASNASSYTGDGTSGMFFWGTQLEQGSIPSDYLSVAAAAPNNVPNIAVAMLSTRFNFPAGVKAPYTPVWLSQTYELLVANTLGGQFMGNKVLRQGAKASINLVSFDRTFGEATILPFRDHYNLGKAFVWAAGPSIFSKDVGYLWREPNSIMAPRFDENGSWMSVGMEVMAYGE